jgi:hypothetical protein
LAGFDTPSITDSATLVRMFVITDSDTPSITDSATVSANLFPSDAPSITDDATVTPYSIS